MSWLCKPRRIKLNPVSISCVVSHAMDEHGSGGSVQCFVQNATHPLTIEWMHDKESALIELSPDRLHATKVRPGNYSVTIRDAHNNVGTCDVTLILVNYPIIFGYNVTHATCDAARDGQIEVVAKNLRGHKFLWNTGVITVTPVLMDVSPGQYSATPLCDDNPMFIHACGPAIVRPSRNIARIVEEK